MHIRKYGKHHTPSCIKIQDVIFFLCAFCYCFTNHICRQWLHVILQQTTQVLPIHLYRANGKGAWLSAISKYPVCNSYFPKPDKSTCAALQKLKGFFDTKPQGTKSGISHLSRVSAPADHSHATTSKPARRHSNDLQGA